MTKVGKTYNLAGQPGRDFTVIQRDPCGSYVIAVDRELGGTVRIPVSKLGYPYKPKGPLTRNKGNV